MQGPLREGTLFVWKTQGFQVSSTLSEIDRPKRLSWTGSAFGTKAFHLWEIETVGDTVLVKTFETFDGWVPWLFKASMQKKLDETLPAWLQALKQAADGQASGAMAPVASASPFPPLSACRRSGIIW